MRMYVCTRYVSVPSRLSYGSMIRGRPPRRVPSGHGEWVAAARVEGMWRDGGVRGAAAAAGCEGLEGGGVRG